MNIAVIVTKEGAVAKRAFHGAFLDIGQAERRVAEMNKAMKKEMFEAVLLRVEG